MAKETTSHTWTRAVSEEVGARSRQPDVTGALELDLIRRRLEEESLKASTAGRESNPLDDLVFLPANLTRMVIDPYREPCSTVTEICGRFARHPMQMQMPLIVGPLAFRSASENGKEAIRAACEQCGIAYTVEGSDSLPENGSCVLRVPGTDQGLEAAQRASASAVEISFDRKSDNSDQHQFADTIAAVRKKVDGQIPIGLSLGPENVRENVVRAVEARADFLVLDLVPVETDSEPAGDDELQTPRLSALSSAVVALRKQGHEETIPIICRGGIRNGADVARIISIGCAAAVLDHTALIAISESPVSTIPSASQKSSDDQAESLARALKATSHEITLVARACGKTDIHNLEPEDLRALSLAAATAAGVPIVGQ
jgi:glutamate synthase domain-containing protein 2